MKTRIISLIVIAMTTLGMNVQAQSSFTDKKSIGSPFFPFGKHTRSS